MYEFKNLPKASEEQFQFPPRDRIVPEDQTPGEPAILSIEDAEVLHEKRAKKAAAYRSGSNSRASTKSSKNYAAQEKTQHYKRREKEASNKNSQDSTKTSSNTINTSKDPWAKWRK
jgi:hypothetical protein